MTFIITEPCISTCDTACVAVCPVDCIHGPIDKEGAGAEVEGMDSVAGMQLYIHPDECIDCGVCEPECPVEAIKSEDDLTDGENVFLELNAELSKEWPVITEMADDPLPDAEEWAGKEGKLDLLER